MLIAVAGVAHSITGHKQTQLYRVCYFRFFGAFLTFKGSNYSEFFLPMRQSFSIFSGAGKFCLAHGLRQLTRDAKMMSERLISEVT